MEKEMTKKEFLKKVKEMRQAQKNYFATRRKSYLFQSKDLEKQVDEMISFLEMFESE